MSREQKIRAVLFYLSAFIFLFTLPFILSFALGYKFDRRKLKLTKAGILVLRTQPAEAEIYLDGKLLNEKTPTTLNELLPGNYQIKLELEKHYPWAAEVQVEAGKVTRLEKIILFPLRPNIKRLNKELAAYFWLDEEKGHLYYLNKEDNIIYRSDLEGQGEEGIGRIAPLTPGPLKYKFSPDREKLLYFNATQVGITIFAQIKGKAFKNASFVLNQPQAKIIDAFWHSDSYHFILATQKDIQVWEAEPGSSPLTLVNLNQKNPSVTYDLRNDTLYFIDSQRASDGNFYDNLYKLELNTHSSLFQELIKLRSNE